MRPAFSSRTKRRGATALAPALRLLFLTASDMWHPYCDLTRNWSALDRDCAANACHDIEWDDRRWKGCAFSSPSSGAADPCCALAHFGRKGLDDIADPERLPADWRRNASPRLDPAEPAFEQVRPHE